MWLDSLNEMKKKSGKTTGQISEESGVPVGTLNKIFAGQTKDPKYQTIYAIVHCLGFTVDDLEKEKSPDPEQTGSEEKVTREQLVDLLSRMGYLDENGNLSDEDLRFLMSVVAMLDAWFTARDSFHD